MEKQRDSRSSMPSLRGVKRRSNPAFLAGLRWIASLALAMTRPARSTPYFTKPTLRRHGRARPGHPRPSWMSDGKNVDARQRDRESAVYGVQTAMAGHDGRTRFVALPPRNDGIRQPTNAPAIQPPT